MIFLILVILIFYTVFLNMIFLKNFYTNLIFNAKIFKHINKNNYIFTKTELPSYLYYSFDNLYNFNLNYFYKNFFLSKFFKRFFLFNNFFINLIFFNKFILNKSNKLIIRRFFKKRFKFFNYKKFENKDSFFFLNYLNFFNFLFFKKKFKFVSFSKKKKLLYFFYLFNQKLFDERMFVYLCKYSYKYSYKNSNINIQFPKNSIRFKKSSFFEIGCDKFFKNFKSYFIYYLSFYSLSQNFRFSDFFSNFIAEFFKFFKNEFLILVEPNFIRLGFFFLKDNFYFYEFFVLFFLRSIEHYYDLHLLYVNNYGLIDFFLQFLNNFFFINKMLQFDHKLNPNFDIFYNIRFNFFHKHQCFLEYFNYRKNNLLNNNDNDDYINDLYNIKIEKFNFFFDVDLFFFIFLKLNNLNYDVYDNFYFFEDLEKIKFKLFFFGDGVAYLYRFIFKKTFKFFDGVSKFILLKNTIKTSKLLPLRKNKLTKKLKKQKLKIKYPRFNKKKLKFIKMYKYILKSFFCFYKKYNLTKFFKTIYSSYNLISLNFFFFFINSSFVEEQLVNFKQFGWTNTTNISLRKIKRRFITNDGNINDCYIYNNHLPMLISDLFLKNKFLKAVKTTANVNLNKFHQLYFVSFFESLFNKKFFLRYESNFFKRYKPTNVVIPLIKGYRNYNLKILRNLHISELLEIIWYSFQFKDLKLLNNWLKKIMPMLKLKHHKTLIYALKKLLEKHGNLFMSILRLHGFFFKIKGKISVTGNAKKRSTIIRFGGVHLSTKFKKLEYEEGCINTKVGVLGYKMFLSY